MGAAGVADGVHQSGLDQHGRCDAAAFGDHIENAGRQKFGFRNRLSQDCRRERRLVRHLEYDRATRRQRRPDRADR